MSFSFTSRTPKLVSLDGSIHVRMLGLTRDLASLTFVDANGQDVPVPANVQLRSFFINHDGDVEAEAAAQMSGGFVFQRSGKYHLLLDGQIKLNFGATYSTYCFTMNGASTVS